MSLIQKYVAIGPESTGKSTLCQNLADYFQTKWCPEFARTYLESHGKEYTYNDLLTIAHGQIDAEDAYTRDVIRKNQHDLLIIDTDMHVMRVWCEYVFGNCHKFILDQIAQRDYAGYLLCAPDLPWEADPLREYPDQKIRNELFLYYKELISSQKSPWIVIEGNYEKRISTAINFIEKGKDIL